MDKAQSLRHLQLLGLQEGETVHLRAVDPERGTKFACPYPDLNWRRIRTLQAKGAGIYFVVNVGGPNDASITAARAIFAEHDDLAIDLQRDLWRQLDLPEPTLQVFTGGKSVHSYWVFDQPCTDIQAWKQLQTDLLDYAKGDKSLKNPSRVMRLAGTRYCKGNNLGAVATIISQSGKRYSFEELRKQIPSHTIASTIPLLVLLSTQHRELIIKGEAEGSRDNTGIAIAKDAVGCERWAKQKGLVIQGSAKELLEKYCRNCSPPLDLKSAQRLLSSAEKSDPLPCLDNDRLWRRVKAYLNKLNLQISKGSEERQNSPLVKPLVKRLDDSVAEEVRQLREQNNLPHSGLLPDKLRDPLAEQARRLNAPLEALEIGALVVAASQLPCPVRLVVDPATDYRVPPILNVVFVAESGSGKTPVLKTVCEPLKKLQSADDAVYEEKFREYEEQLAKWENGPKNKRGQKPKEPIARERYFTDFTVEALAANLGKRSDFGALLYNDELSGLFCRLDQYRGGKGGDRQFFLELYDGGSIKVNRKGSKRISVPKTQVSIIGGIQPAIIRKIWREDKSRHDGMWVRFCYLNFQIVPHPGIQKGEPTKLPRLLEEFYRQMEQIGSTGKDIWEYNFDDEGIERWNKWNEEINEMILAEPSEVLRASLAKTRDRAARLALCVHLAEAALSMAEPNPIVPASTLEKGIQFARWLFGQHRLLCAELGEADSPESAKITRFLQRFEQAGWIDTRQVQRWGNFKTAVQARQFMSSLVAGSLAEERQEPKYQIRVANTNQKPRESEPSRKESTEKQLDGLPSRLVPSSLLKTHNGIPPHEFDC